VSVAEIKNAATAVLRRINNGEKLHTNIAKQTAEGALRLIGDLESAAGDCPIALPMPGSDTAKLLSANVLLRQQQDKLTKGLVVLLRERNEARASAMGYGAVCIQEGVCEADECHDIIAWKKEAKEAGLLTPDASDIPDE